MKKFDVPSFYKSSFVSKIKEMRKDLDPRKKDYLPSTLDFGPVKFYMARHFGFCFGVENAIEIAYRAIDENPGKRIYLLSEMIHNPQVNEDLLSRGVQFIMDTKGEQLIAWDVLDSSDVIILPAFGTTIEIENRISKIGLDTFKYNTTCPFVERVWKMSSKLGDGDYTISWGDGDDIITGGFGNDTLEGNLGRDNFFFFENFGSDVITDFDESFDIISYEGTNISLREDVDESID